MMSNIKSVVKFTQKYTTDNTTFQNDENACYGMCAAKDANRIILSNATVCPGILYFVVDFKDPEQLNIELLSKGQITKKYKGLKLIHSNIKTETDLLLDLYTTTADCNKKFWKDTIFFTAYACAVGLILHLITLYTEYLKAKHNIVEK